MDWLDKIRTRHLDMLVSLAQTRNLTRTATELGMHQSGISKMLRELEEDLGLTLFERRSRGVALTEQGGIACDHARRIKAAMEGFRDEMKVLAHQGGALVSLGISGASSIDALPSAVLSLLKRHPDTHVRITEGAADPMQSKLANYEIDLLVAQSGLRFDPVHQIREEVLWTDTIRIAARAGHPLGQKASVTWEEVCAYPLAVWALGTPIRRAMDQSLAAKGWSLPPSYLESNSASINMNLLLNSDMIGFSMGRGAQSYEALGVLCILPLDLGATGSMSVYWRREDEHRRYLAAFLSGLHRQQ